MTPEEINSAIAQVKSDIAAKEASISAAQSNIEQLELLKEYCSSYQTDFEECKDFRRTKLDEFIAIQEQPNPISTYEVALDDLLDGTDYENAYDSMSSAISAISQEISNQQQLVNDYNYNLAGLKSSLQYWEGKL